MSSKCDTKRPECSLCARVGHNCHYRNVNELMFRDETSTTIFRSRKKQRPPSNTNTSIERSSRTIPDIRGPCFQHDQRWYSLTTPRLSDSLPDVAIHQWLTKYVLGSHLEFITSFCHANAFREPFRSAVTSVALASFANELPWQRLSKMALEHYNRAICQTQKVIQNPESAQSNDALAAVLLLSSFETVSVDVSTSARNWTSHVRGAYALLSARGASLLETPFGRKMFMQVVSSVTLDCLQSQTRLPESLQDMMNLMADSDLPSPRQSFQRIVGGLIDLRASIAEGEITDASQIVSLATQLDDEAQVLESNMQRHPDYSYTVVQADATKICGEVQHLYPSTNATLLWNSLRMLRILANDILVSQLPVSEVPLDGSAALQRCKARATVSRTCLEICESIPQAAGPRAKHDAFDHVAAVNFSIWPLFKAGSSALASATVRHRALGKLTELGHRHHVHRAFIAAEQLKRRDHSDVWMHVNHMF